MEEIKTSSEAAELDRQAASGVFSAARSEKTEDGSGGGAEVAMTIKDEGRSMIDDKNNPSDEERKIPKKRKSEERSAGEEMGGSGGDRSSTDDGKNPSSEESGIQENGSAMKRNKEADLEKRIDSRVERRRRSVQKKFHRRKKKAGEHHNGKQWKPYSMLSWEEKKKLDERETERAEQYREERFASGQPMAPYNTTQFLMEQHEPTACELRSSPTSHHDPAAMDYDRRYSGDGSWTGESSEEELEEAEYLEKDFAEAYESFHAERIQAMTKSDLIKEYLEMESKLTEMQRRGGQELDSPTRPAVPLGMSAGALAAELQRLREDNARLVRENQQLKALITPTTDQAVSTPVSNS